MLYNQVCKYKILLFLLIVISTVSYAQEDTGKQLKANTDTSKKIPLKDQTEQKLSSEKKLPNIPQQIKVLEVFNAKYNNNDSADKRHRASIGDIIVVKVANMDSLIKLSQKICLFVNGRIISNIFPISGAPQKIGDSVWELQFQLDRNQDNDRIWTTILGSPPLFNHRFFIEPVTVSIGLQNGYAIETNNNFNESNFQFERIHQGWFWWCFLIIFLYLIIFIMMVKNGGLLRDRTIDLSAVGIINNGLPKAYSLGRFQMAFWFTLTVISFFFIWLITDAYDIITPTVLALIGISAGTSLSAAVIDNSKSTDLLNQTIVLQNEKAKLNTEIPKLDELIKNAASDNADLISKKKSNEDRVIEITPLIARNITILTPQPSKGFFNDILTDVNGISFHRLQMLVWTFVLGLIFIYSVWKNLSMPVFGPTLLALQGLTATTYLGFKFPEKQA